MNPALQFIFNRRSVRAYENRPIPDETLTDLLEAAMAAPSAVAKDPWRFIAVTDRETLERMADVLKHGQMLRTAGAGILVCGDIASAHDQLESYMLQDCSAAVENILLAATALGLGACWLGVHPREERMRALAELFALPGGIVPVAGISLGWPERPPAPRTRYNTAFVHWNRWLA